MLRKIKQKIAIRNFEKLINYKKNITYFDFLYQGIDGYACARRLNQQNPGQNIIYGDIDFYAFAAALSLLKPTTQDTFLDLGSGVGKACVTAALAYNIQHCQGIELEPALHELAMLAFQKANQGLQNQLDLILGDYFNHSLAEATIIYINATALFGPLWQKLSQQLNQQAQTGCRVLVTSKQLDINHFNFLGQYPIQMDYGQSHLHIYEKC